MDKLIEETERRFLSKFGESNGELDIDVDIYVESDQHAFTLNSLVEMDNHLINDTHFQEMVQDVDRYCSEHFFKNIKQEDKYYVFVCGLLRGLLRECVSVYDPFERKQVIEKVYRWYRDKRKLLLDYKLRVFKRQTLGKKEEKKSLVGYEDKEEQNENNELETIDEYSDLKTPRVDPHQHVSIEYLRSRLKEKIQSEQDVLPDPTDYQQRKATHFDPRVEKHDVLSGLSNDPSIPFYMSNEKKRKVFVHQKLKQYSKRNIQKTEELRQASAEMLPSQISSPTSSMSTSFFGKQTSKTIPEKKKRLADVYAYTERTDKEKGKNVQKTWLMHRVKEAEEHLETLEMNDVVSSWSSNRARIQEEIFRRHESSQYSAQTGSRIQNVIKSNELTAEKNRRLKSLKLKRRIVNNFLDSSSDEDSTIDNSVGDEEGFEVKNERMIDVSHEGIQTTGIDELPVFLSPYNNLKEVGPVKIQSSMYLEDVVQEPTAVLKGFLSPTTHANIPKKSKQRVLLMDIIQNNTLSRSNSMNNLQKADSKFSQGLDHLIRPSSTSSTRKVHKSKRNSLTPTSPSAARGKGISASKISSLAGPEIVPDIPEITKPSFGRYLDKGKVVMHNVYELYANQVVKHNEVVIKNMKPNRNGVPTTQGSTKTIQRPPSPKSPSSSRPVSSRTRGNISNRIGSSHPSLPEPKEPIFQTLSDFGHPPSLLYGAQMDECERIKLELSKRKIHIPSKVLERSIVIPEDKPFSVCKRDLPSPSAGLIEDVSLLPARRRRPRSGRSTRTPRSSSGSRPNTGRPNSSRLPSSRASTAR